jgi:DNA-binding NtrC family response regulator
MAHILVIDDEASIRTILRRMLEAEGHTIVEAADGDEGLGHFRAEPPDLVITDIFMPNREGLETIMAMRRTEHPVPIIAISGGGASGEMTSLALANRMGAVSTLQKPFDRETLLKCVRKALDAA